MNRPAQRHRLVALLVMVSMGTAMAESATEGAAPSLTDAAREMTTSVEAQLLALDEMNPRAIRFQLDGIRDQLSHLPGASGRGSTVALSRAVAALHSRLDRATPETLDTAALWAFRADLAALSDLVTEGYLR